jgi:hypothetical protein
MIKKLDRDLFFGDIHFYPCIFLAWAAKYQGTCFKVFLLYGGGDMGSLQGCQIFLGI